VNSIKKNKYSFQNYYSRIFLFNLFIYLFYIDLLIIIEISITKIILHHLYHFYLIINNFLYIGLLIII